ncbi:tocopherol cyclase family protein [Raineyella sp. LH-20]|uniref:tocopherol cyclase family protein n=1 Tax=Raineyella sp. LH-20 TaxID=3081204 RepID=UPI0029539B07|nr:tocopherol cyclase family protein [Raineyella sp. LH-20]WOP18396.1 tocopherol cyclase family protein [Raineyella sp. LH-20]
MSSATPDPDERRGRGDPTDVSRSADRSGFSDQGGRGGRSPAGWLAGIRARTLAAYRATGADLPWGDLRRAHGVAMEGYFWRFTDVERSRVVIALIGVNRGPHGPWATVALAGSNGFLRTAALPGAWADPYGLGAASPGSDPHLSVVPDPAPPPDPPLPPVSPRRGGRTSVPPSAGNHLFVGNDRILRVDLGPDARLDLRLDPADTWPAHRALGGSSGFQLLPGLNQYWHPWLLGGRAAGEAILGGEIWRLDGAAVYGEKNWGKEGFPEAWWWGQAQGFAEPAACVAFAGGKVVAGPLSTTVTALVVRLPDGRLLRFGNPGTSPVRADIGPGQWHLDGRGRGWRVIVDGAGDPSAAHVLPVPLPSQQRNVAGDVEHLAARMAVRVERRGRTSWVGESTLAGLEIGGFDSAREELRRRGAPADAIDAPPAAPAGGRRDPRRAG